MTTKKTYFISFVLFYFSVGVFSQNLDIVWQNTIEGTDNDVLYSIFETSDNGFVIGGKSTSSISGDKNENSIGLTDYWILKLTSSGEIEWQNTIGGSLFDDLHAIK